MFNVTGGEVVIILVLALVVLGPEKLPEMLRKVGQLYGEMRRMTSGFQNEFEETFKEPLREFRETANQARDMIKNPLADHGVTGEDEIAPAAAADRTDAVNTSTSVHAPPAGDQADDPIWRVSSAAEPPFAPVVEHPDAGFQPPDQPLAPVAVLPPPLVALPPPPPPSVPATMWTAPPAETRGDPWSNDGGS